MCCFRKNGLSPFTVTVYHRKGEYATEKDGFFVVFFAKDKDARGLSDVIKLAPFPNLAKGHEKRPPPAAFPSFYWGALPSRPPAFTGAGRRGTPMAPA